jgi:hypothetical protein
MGTSKARLRHIISSIIDSWSLEDRESVPIHMGIPLSVITGMGGRTQWMNRFERGHTAM